MLDNFVGKSMEGKGSVAAISDDLYEIAYDQPFRFPATFTFVMRALSTLEGLGKGLDPKFNFMEIAKPFATKLMENGSSKESGSLSTAIFGELGRQAAEVGSSALGLPKRLEETIVKLERGDIRLRVRSQESDRLLRRISNIGIGGIYSLLAAAFSICATILLVNGWVWIAGGLGTVALGLLVALIRLLAKLERNEKMF
jgi:predicted unusual protein kinase regulating ubiquinone biosynthesis (AarF/ABC1/UbiB family)